MKKKYITLEITVEIEYDPGYTHPKTKELIDPEAKVYSCSIYSENGQIRNDDFNDKITDVIAESEEIIEEMKRQDQKNKLEEIEAYESHIDDLRHDCE